MKITCQGNNFFSRKLDQVFKGNIDASKKDGNELKNAEGVVLKDNKV
jgi:hypothetical protein